jgi:mono/diheme cytochrome c family protein
MLNAMRPQIQTIFLLSLLLAAAPAIGHAQDNPALVKRGSYLVNQIAKCGDCHTPRTATGMPDKSRSLKGTPLAFRPVAPVPGWASASPDLTAGGSLWKTWGEKGMVQFFTTGKTPDGKPAAPPMPSYTLDSQDARAIVAYLQSLP